MAGTTTDCPMTVNDLINKLKLLPGDWKVKVETSDGVMYIKDLEISEDCEVAFVMIPLEGLDPECDLTCNNC